MPCSVRFLGAQNACGQGWIEGVAILIAVFIVAIVTAGNDYSKELQFRALEKTSEEDNRAMVLRDGILVEVWRI